ncbi:MAG: MBL fold metallo-hydrolase [Candidatus Hydrogenedens sp.]|jgi:glyoxylase-like metal-dependent hydrolase (beta-lactamase superfamily II)/8-oxo-dGTP pyrophosphatase MutT (NUDIX family)|nr:MBL fold metallo-hydrolase [Candidatus Hydrogenedens sp.]
MSNWLNYNSVEGAVPRLAAVIIVYEHRKNRLLFVKRNPALSFMGGHHAFPGGGLSKSDTGQRVIHGSDKTSDAFLTAAVRELFEETGLLLTTAEEPLSFDKEAFRRKTIDDPAVFEAFLKEQGLFIDGRQFYSAGRWITPSFSPIRFDTHYFFCALPEALPATPMGSGEEIVDVEWLTPAEALERRGSDAIQISTPVVFVLQRLNAFPLEEALQRLRQTPGFSKQLLDYIEPFQGIHIVPLETNTLPPATHTNCVLIGEEAIYIVDPGAAEGAAQEAFYTHLEEVCQNVGGRPAGILLTHDHPDHNAAAAALSRRYEIPVYAHKDINSSELPSQELTDGTILEIPGARPWIIRCIHTPGHHPGHICFLEETTGTLLCGDMISNPGTIMIDPDQQGDMGLYMASLERLCTFPVKLTIPGHGEPLMNGEGIRLLQKTWEHRKARERKIKKLWDQGVQTEKELLAQAYDDTPPELHPLALRQLKAHLIHLLGKDAVPF